MFLLAPSPQEMTQPQLRGPPCNPPGLTHAGDEKIEARGPQALLCPSYGGPVSGIPEGHLNAWF